MKSDVMASIFMFTKNVGEQKMSFPKYYIFSSKNTTFFVVKFLSHFSPRISIVVKERLKSVSFGFSPSISVKSKSTRKYHVTFSTHFKNVVNRYLIK